MGRLPYLSLWLLLAGIWAGCPADPQTDFLPDATCGLGGPGQPAIALTVGVHVRDFDTGSLAEYETSRDELDYLAGWAAAHDLRLEIALNGYQAEGALLTGETQRFAGYADAGHAFGVHHHPSVRIAELTWTTLGDDPTDAELQQSVDDHRDWIGQALDPAGIEYRGGHVRLTGRTGWWYGMMVDSGYTTETIDAWSVAATEGEEADRNFDLLHPFRWSVDAGPGELLTDPDVPFIAIPQHPQVGILGKGEHLGFDGSVEHLQALMWLAYLEWRAAVLAGEDPLPWVFGYGSHPELGTAQNPDLDRLADHIQQYFTDPTDGFTGRSTCGMTRPEIVEMVETLEAEYPGRTVFEYRPGEAYPYRNPDFPWAYNGHLIAVHDDYLDRGVRFLELQRHDGTDATTLDDLIPGNRFIVAWADVVEGEVEVDLQPWCDSHGLEVRTATRYDEGVDPRRVSIGTEATYIGACYEF